MIIISQDKKSISNFENIIGIQINEHILNSDGEKDYEIKVITEKRECTIGVYETEERAKEVLNEIIQTKTNFEYYKYADESHRNEVDTYMRTKYNFFDTYEMPIE